MYFTAYGCVCVCRVLDKDTKKSETARIDCTFRAAVYSNLVFIGIVSYPCKLSVLQNFGSLRKCFRKNSVIQIFMHKFGESFGVHKPAHFKCIGISTI